MQIKFGKVAKKIKRISEKGVTLIEGLVSTAIIGIGFVAVFQMVQYSVRSIDVSGERTKATYIAGTIAEDIFAFKNQETSSKTFVDLLKDNEWKSEKCEEKAAHTFNKATAYENKIAKWNSRVSKNYLKCVDGTKDKKNLKVFLMCHSGCPVTKNQSHDKIYAGRMEINMQSGTKKKYLYFQIK